MILDDICSYLFMFVQWKLPKIPVFLVMAWYGLIWPDMSRPARCWVAKFSSKMQLLGWGDGKLLYIESLCLGRSCKILWVKFEVTRCQMNHLAFRFAGLKLSQSMRLASELEETTGTFQNIQILRLKSAVPSRKLTQACKSISLTSKWFTKVGFSWIFVDFL